MFSPIQSLLINPDNVSPVSDSSNSSSASSYFTDPAVLDRVPASMLYLAAIYAAVLSIGLLLTSEPPQEVEEEKSSKQVSINLYLSIQMSTLYLQNIPSPCWRDCAPPGCISTRTRPGG